MTPHVSVELPIRTVSEANVREHWSKRAKRAKEQRAVTAILMRRAGLRRGAAVCRVRMTRLSQGMLDSDNLGGAMKAVRDGVADVLGCDDSEKAGIDWQYRQERTRRGVFGVDVEVFVKD